MQTWYNPFWVTSLVWNYIVRVPQHSSSLTFQKFKIDGNGGIYKFLLEKGQNGGFV